MVKALEMLDIPSAAIDLIKFGLIIGSGLGAAFAVFIGFRKGNGTAKPVEAAVVSATLADGQAVRELINVMHRLCTEICDSRDQRHRDSMQEREAMHEMTDTMRRGGLPANWLELLGQTK